MKEFGSQPALNWTSHKNQPTLEKIDCGSRYLFIDTKKEIADYVPVCPQLCSLWWWSPFWNSKEVAEDECSMRGEQNWDVEIISFHILDGLWIGFLSFVSGQLLYLNCANHLNFGFITDLTWYWVRWVPYRSWKA